jgi:rRNA maturation protein Nop10
MLIMTLGVIIAIGSLAVVLPVAPPTLKNSPAFGLTVLLLGTWILLQSTRALAPKIAARCPHCGGLVTMHSKELLIRRSTLSRQCATCGSLLP